MNKIKIGVAHAVMKALSADGCVGFVRGRFQHISGCDVIAGTYPRARAA